MGRLSRVHIFLGCGSGGGAGGARDMFNQLFEEKNPIGVHRMVLQCFSYRLRNGSKIMPYVENCT
jgi:hypothetical protein